MRTTCVLKMLCETGREDQDLYQRQLKGTWIKRVLKMHRTTSREDKDLYQIELKSTWAINCTKNVSANCAYLDYYQNTLLCRKQCETDRER